VIRCGQPSKTPIRLPRLRRPSPAVPGCLSIGSAIDCYPEDWPARIMSTFYEVPSRTKVFGGYGHVAMIAGGILVARKDFSGEHWADGTSRPMINAGATKARMEATRDPLTGEDIPRVGTLVNPAGCNN